MAGHACARACAECCEREALLAGVQEPGGSLMQRMHPKRMHAKLLLHLVASLLP